MRLSELFEDSKTKTSTPISTPRNFVAKNAKTSGAGSHTEKKFTRKEKHRDTTADKQ